MVLHKVVLRKITTEAIFKGQQNAHQNLLDWI